ncbi:hypothetical protein [Streptomyces sp. NPDC006368]|uniref:hypothetical protein n=1 Tax=Streptomyces sp. NPDC006368 TaxID=3156760 RepID=UPI0033B811CF
MAVRSANHPGSPIYDQLVEEHGDVLVEVRELADRTRRQADRLLHWDTGSRSRGHFEEA